MKNIKTFKSHGYSDVDVEGEANNWINQNNITVIDIKMSYSFWTGHECIVIYEKDKTKKA